MVGFRVSVDKEAAAPIIADAPAYGEGQSGRKRLRIWKKMDLPLSLAGWPATPRPGRKRLKLQALRSLSPVDRGACQPANWQATQRPGRLSAAVCTIQGPKAMGLGILTGHQPPDRGCLCRVDTSSALY